MRLLLQHLFYGVLACAMAYGQATSSFDVASVKPSNAGVRSSMRGGPGTSDPGRITYTNVTLFNVLLRAYNVKSYQLSAPDWMSSQRYDIAAKIPPGTSKESFERMLQSLAAERFHLALHRETHDLKGYDLAAGRTGPRLKASQATDTPAVELKGLPKTDANGFPQLDAPGLVMMEGARGKAVVIHLTANAQPLSALVELLSKEFAMPIQDMTGLSGKFDFHLEFAPQPPGVLEAAPPADDAAPNLVTAVQQQLGLRLNSSKVGVEVLVIDRADRVPTEN